MSTAATRPDETGGGSAPARGRALVVVPQPAGAPGWFASLGRSHGAVAAGVAAVMGIGFVAGTQVFASKPPSPPVAALQAAPVAVAADTTADALRRVQDEVRSLRAGVDGLRAGVEDGRQADALRGLKRSVEALKQDFDGVKATAAQPDPRLAGLASRIDRMERQLASADATGSLPAAAAAEPVPAPAARPAAPGSAALTSPRPEVARPDPSKPEASKPEASKPEAIRPEAARAEAPKAEAAKAPAARPDAPAAPRPVEAAPRPAVVQGWLLRDVYGGVALVEGRSGGLREVAPGEFVPGAGEIRSIERRGRGWVVVTSRGVIVADTRW